MVGEDYNAERRQRQLRNTQPLYNATNWYVVVAGVVGIVIWIVLGSGVYHLCH